MVAMPLPCMLQCRDPLRQEMGKNGKDGLLRRLRHHRLQRQQAHVHLCICSRAYRVDIGAISRFDSHSTFPTSLFPFYHHVHPF